jgi:hypothetical protein
MAVELIKIQLYKPFPPRVGCAYPFLVKIQDICGETEYILWKKSYNYNLQNDDEYRIGIFHVLNYNSIYFDQVVNNFPFPIDLQEMKNYKIQLGKYTITVIFETTRLFVSIHYNTEKSVTEFEKIIENVISKNSEIIHFSDVYSKGKNYLNQSPKYFGKF